MKPHPAINLDFDPRQLIGYREVAALLGVSEHTVRAGGKEYSELLARSFWVGRFRRWQAGFVYDWMAQKQRAALAQAEVAEQQRQELSNVVSIARSRKQAAKSEQEFWAEIRAEGEARRQRLARRGKAKKPKPVRELL